MAVEHSEGRAVVFHVHEAQYAGDHLGNVTALQINDRQPFRQLIGDNDQEDQKQKNKHRVPPLMKR